MNTFALFDDGTMRPIVVGFYEPEDQPLRLNPINIQDLDIIQSANNGFHAAFQVLKNLGYSQARYCISYQFKEEGRSNYAHGGSAGLAFCLKFALESYNRHSDQPLGYSIAATGVITDGTEQAEVKPVEKVREKLKAAISLLQKGDKIFYPLDNDREIEPDTKTEAAEKGIEVYPVSTVKQAIRRLFEKYPEEKYPVEIDGLGDPQSGTVVYQVDRQCWLGRKLIVPFQIANKGRLQVKVEVRGQQAFSDWLEFSSANVELPAKGKEEALICIPPRNNRFFFYLRHFFKLSFKKQTKISIILTIPGIKSLELSRDIQLNVRFLNPWPIALFALIVPIAVLTNFLPSHVNKLPGVSFESQEILFSQLTNALEQGRYLEAKKEIDNFLKRLPTGNDRIARLNRQLTDRLHLKINFGYLKSGMRAEVNKESFSRGKVLLRSGDSYRFEFTAEDDCHLYAFLLDPNQNLVRLFPNSDFTPTQNPVQPGRSYRVPAGENWFVLDQTSGQETIYFVASRWQAHVLESLFKQLIDAADHVKENGIRKKLLNRLNTYKQADAVGLEGCFYKEFSFQHE